MRRSSAHLFLALAVLGVLGPLALLAASCGGCGDCCEGDHSCGAPTGGFSLCCLHSVSNLPVLPLSGVELVPGPSLASRSERGSLPPEPRGILHVPKAS